MDVYLVDGTYELFRHYYALPSARDQQGHEVAAVRGVLASVMGMIKGGATHVAVATDHVIESFRNELWPGYKTGDGIDPDLFGAIPVARRSARRGRRGRLADGGVRSGRCARGGGGGAARDARVEHVIICTPDKDLAQCVRGTRVVQLNRRTRVTLDEAGVIQKFGVRARLDSRLPGAGRRCGGRLSRPAWLGREVDGRGTGEVWPS